LITTFNQLTVLEKNI